MAKQTRKKGLREKGNQRDVNIRFIAPMPGKSSLNFPETKLTYKKLHKFNDLPGDMPLEDYQADFLMQREYIID